MKAKHFKSSITFSSSIFITRTSEHLHLKLKALFNTSSQFYF